MFNDFHKLLSHYSLYLLNKILMVFNWHIYIYILCISLSLSLLSTNSKLHWFWPTQHRPLAGQPHSHTGRWSKRGGSCGVGTRLYSPGIQGPTFLHWNADQLSCFFHLTGGLLKDQAQSLAIVLDAKFTGQRPVLLVKTRHAKLKGEHW